MLRRLIFLPSVRYLRSGCRISGEFNGGWAIETEGLRKSFSDVEALCGIDLQVEAGTVLGLLGPNGAGKTTAVRILTTLLPPTRRAAPGSPGSTSSATPPSCASGSGSPASTPPSTRASPGSRTWRWSGASTTSAAGVARDRANELLEGFDLAEAASGS